MVNTMEILSRLDKKGRIEIPKEIRDKLGLDETKPVKIYLEGTKIVIEPMKKVKKVKIKNVKEAFFDAGEATFGK